MEVRVLSHALRHGLGGRQVAFAWESPIRCRARSGTDDPVLWIAVGALPDGRLCEMVAFQDSDGAWCVFHAMSPPTKKFLRELGLAGRRR